MTDENDTKNPRLKYIEDRWEGLHSIEQKRIDGLLNFLLMVGLGLTGAALAYLGSIVKVGAKPNTVHLTEIL